jgi:hypothetical protein
MQDKTVPVEYHYKKYGHLHSSYDTDLVPIHKEGEWGAGYQVTGKGEDPLIQRSLCPLAVI